MWDALKCDLCGECLANCRYVDYDTDRAVSEIRLLMAGKEADILKACITCVSCNDYCPTGADPSNLIFKMQEALERLESGEYGVCEECGEDIGIARLKARPVTTLCIECKSNQEIAERKAKQSV